MFFYIYLLFQHLNTNFRDIIRTTILAQNFNFCFLDPIKHTSIINWKTVFGRLETQISRVFNISTKLNIKKREN